MLLSDVDGFYSGNPKEDASAERYDVIERITPEIEAADHGMRNDGGVDGPSLAQRVNLGAALVN